MLYFQINGIDLTIRKLHVDISTPMSVTRHVGKGRFTGFNSVPSLGVSSLMLMLMRIAGRNPPAIKTIKMKSHHGPAHRAFAYKQAPSSTPGIYVAKRGD